MALSFSLNPPSTSHSSSQPLYFLLFPLQTRFAYAPKPLSRFRVCCSQRLVEPETDQQQQPRRVKVVPFQKKKRKPRPSFLEQIQEKWSAKVGSRRDSFPWQEQRGRVEAEFEAESVTESETTKAEPKASTLKESVSFGRKSGVVSAPWYHGNRASKPFEPEPKENGDRDDNVDGFGVRVVNEVFEHSNGFDREFESQRDEIQEGDSNVEERTIDIGTKGLYLSETVDGRGKDGILVSSGYDSGDLAENAAEFESGVGDKSTWRRRNTVVAKKTLSEQRNTAVPELKPGVGEKSTWRRRDNEAAEKTLPEQRNTLVLELKSGVGEKSMWRRGKAVVAETMLPEQRNTLVPESESGVVENSIWRRRNTEVAEKTLPEHELKRLRNVSLRMVGRIKVGARGLTQEVVDTIRDKWELDEVVKLKFEEPLSLNMRRTHEMLESKTGGLVIWRSGGLVVLYRGMTYNLPCVKSYTTRNPNDTTKLADSEDDTSNAMPDEHVKDSVETLESSSPIPAHAVQGLSNKEIQHLNDLNKLLDELGPRFADWLGREPLPVDADLLPGVVPDYKPPFRVLPYGVRHCLGDNQMTIFRRTARTMPPHFALGRNRELQGLAKAMVKLWEKSALAKIAIKRGVENTRNERMAEELKRLTGGTLLSRNKDYIVFYRGNDFLPPAVMEALDNRRKLRDLLQDEEEQVRQMAPAFTEPKTKALTEQLVAGTLAETNAATARWGDQPSSIDIEKMVKDSSLARCKAILKHLEKKLALAKANLAKADKALAKLQEDLNLSGPPDDLETLTDEERVLFRKMGLSMKPFLLLGRRGFYGGTIENIHLHWKHRELVKVIMKAKYLDHVKHVAVCLEAESGGVLVSVDKTHKGFAIILYRGKNYQRPVKIRPQNLLTKRQALARSKEVQRREALRRHVSDLKERIELLKSELGGPNDENMVENREKSISAAEDSISSEDEWSEDDDDNAYLELHGTDGEDKFAD